MIETYHRIYNLPEFVHNIKKEATKIFIMSYKDSDVFISKYDDKLLTDLDIEYEMQPYLIIKDYTYYIDSERIDTLLKDVYQQLVYKILNKLVESNVLELCWDDNLINFVWRKKKYARIGKIKSKTLKE